MKHPILCALIFAAVCCFTAPQQVKAATGYSDIHYNEFFNIVKGYSETQLSYSEAYYYDAVVYSNLYNQYGFLLDQGAAAGDWIVSVNTQAITSPGVRYDLYGDHYVAAYFYYCDYYCDSPRYSDYYGFDFYPENTFYGNFYSFYGYYQCYVFYYDIYLGTTGDSVSVPQPCPDTKLIIHTKFGDLNEGHNDKTKPALVGASVEFWALASSPNITTTAGPFRWSADGGAQELPVADSPGRYKVYWTSEGIKKVTVRYTPPGSDCEVSATVYVNVTLPEFVSFQANQVPNQINAGAGCSGLGGVTYTLGCSQVTADGEEIGQPGIQFTASFRPPTGYISSPEESHIKFVQIVNAFSKKRNLGASDFQCMTARGYSTGWQLDNDDPYDCDFTSNPPRCDLEGIKNFLFPSQEGTVTITTSDSPGHELDGPIYGTLDYLYLDHKFEMYVVYFVDAGASVRRVLAKLPWSFGGEVVRDVSLNPPYRETATIRVDEPIQGAPSVNIQTPYFGNVRNLEYGSCLSNPDPTPEPCLEPPYYTREARRPSCQ